MNRSFKNEHLDIWIDNGIVFVTHHAECLTLKIAMEGVKHRLNLMDGKTMPMLADIRKVKHTEKEVRVYLAQPIGSAQLSAGALLVKSVFQETIGNLFVYFDKPLVPARLFTKEDEALEWLQDYKEDRG